MSRAGGARQQIRPSLAELKDLPPEFDISEGEEEEDDDVPTYAPSAKLTRGPAPAIGAASSTSPATGREANFQPGQSEKEESNRQSEKTVRFAADAEADPERVGGGAARQDTRSRAGAGRRFTVSLDDEDEGQDDEDTTTKLPSLSPLVGTIQERKPAMPSGSASQPKSDRSGQSRFAARRQLDRDAGVIPTSRADDVPTVGTDDADAEAEVWLGEDGQPMSAFRKNRLLKQGLRPPSMRAMETPKAPTTAHKSPPTNDMQDANLSSLLQAISAENDAKIAAMSVDDIEEDLRDLRETLGADLLEKLRKRRIPKGASKEEDAAAKLSMPAAEEPRTRVTDTHGEGTEATAGEDSLASIRRRYFSNEPEALPNSMKWMQDPAIGARGAATGGEYRFGFDGRHLPSNDTTDTDDSTVLAGLHHHGDDQDRPGYSIGELLHLARSTLPSQRVVALQTIARVVSNYGEIVGEKDSGEYAAICANLVRQNARGQACLISSWYVEDRQANVRATSIACIKACLASTLAGPSPVKFVEPPRCGKTANEPQQTSEEDAGEAVLPSIYDDDVQEGLATSLLHSLQSGVLSDFDVASALDILLRIAWQSRRIGLLIGAQLKALRTIWAVHLLRGTWPNTSGNAHISLRLLELLLCLVASDRATALSLSSAGLVEPILRFIAVPPWTLVEEGAQVSAWQHMTTALQVYSALGRYGIASDTYSRSHSLFVLLGQTIRQDSFVATSALVKPFSMSGLAALLDLLSTWTVCATDSHMTHGHHDITWSQVSEWWELALAGLQSAQRAIPGAEANLDRTLAEGASFRLLARWIEGATRNHMGELSDVLKKVNGGAQLYAEAFVTNVAQNLQQELTELNLDLKQNEHHFRTTLPFVERIGNASHALSAFVQLSALASPLGRSSEMQKSLAHIAKLVVQSMPWARMRREDAVQCGSAGPMQSITTMLYVTLQNTELACSAAQWLRLLSVLQEGQEGMAYDVLTERLSACIGDEGKADLAILLPFTKELLRSPSTSIAKHAPLESSPESLRGTDTLFVSTRSKTRDSDDDDVDPLSGAALWKSIGAGLPLQRDWPFAALDDLLHSGTCAALNRPNALPKDWDANELQIVRSSLSLALRLWDSGEDASLGDAYMPSSAEVWMGIIKVFMLEDEQSSNVRATGKITGRDIYRDEQVTRSLTRLFDFAPKLDDDDDLERVAERQYGAAQPFYQLYTSLVGLYDGISFCYELFGRALLTGLQMRYSADYRRLLWNDYGHCLATMTTAVEDAPGGLQAYNAKREEDEGVIRAMSMALLSGNVRKQRNGLLFAVATDQLAQLFWAADSAATAQSRPRSNRLTKALFDEQQGGELHLADVRQAILAWNEASSEEQARRLQWIQQQLSLTT